MKILITGATGFIGFQLALEARRHGHVVVATGQLNNEVERGRAQQLAAMDLAVIEGSVCDADFAKRVVAGCEVVVHLAAAQHEANVPDEYFHRVNVQGTRTLLSAAVARGVKRFVYGSSIGVYGAASGAALTEESATAPANAYGASKLAAESEVKRVASQIEVVIARISETYGPGDYRLLKLFKAADRGLMLMIGGGHNRRQPIHVHDLARGLLLMSEHPAASGETFVLAGPTPITTLDVGTAISSALDRNIVQARLPMNVMLAAAHACERLCKPLKIQPPLHQRRLDYFRKSFFFSTEKARSLLGFEPTIAFAAGARDTAAWYRSQGLLRSTGAPTSNTKTELSLGRSDVPLTTFEGARWHLSDILEYTHDAIIVWEMDGAGIVYWNRAAEQLYGFSRQEAFGRTTHVLLHTQLDGSVSELEEKLSRYGVWIGNLRHRKRDGSSIVVHARLALMAQRNGKWLVLEVNRDLTSGLDMDASQRTLQQHLSKMNESHSSALR